MAKKSNSLLDYLSKFATFFKNKYVATTTIFVLYFLFFCEITPFTHVSLQGTKNDRIKKKAYYEERLKKVKNDKLDNSRNVEKFAREKYYMKKENEDVFIIVGEDDKH